MCVRERGREGRRERGWERSREGDECVCVCGGGNTLKASSSVDTPSPGPAVRQFLCVCA